LECLFFFEFFTMRSALVFPLKTARSVRFQSKPSDAVYRGPPKPIVVKKSGVDLIHDPLWNKGTAYNQEERDRLGIRGLLPARTMTIGDQAVRIVNNLNKIENPYEKFLYMQDLHNRNETLYFKVLTENITTLAPIVYTPTVGQVCQDFGFRFARGRGMYFSKHDRGHFASMVYNWPQSDVHVVVVTDGSRILGLGDLGAHGMGIPIGKLALYTACGGIAPHRVLPVCLDAGTNNEKHLKDEFYMGVQEKRLEGAEYYEMVDEFMQAIYNRYPDVLVQFEDFSSDKAGTLLAKYREKYLCFNDDIQGTGSVTLSGLISACRAKGEKLSDQRIVVVGAGSSGLGVAQQIMDGMVMEGASPEEARKRFYVCSSVGLLGAPNGPYGDKNLKRDMSADRVPWLRKDLPDAMPLLETVKASKATILLGLSTTANIFTEAVVKATLDNTPHPIIFPMSNPTSRSECTALQAYTWTDGKCIFAAGSPYGTVEVPGRSKPMLPSQCNNMYIFPGIGLGASVCSARKITDAMLYRAAEALANTVTAEQREQGNTFPPIKDIRECALVVATAVVEEALRAGLARVDNEAIRANPREFIARKMYNPIYAPLVDPKYATRRPQRSG